MLNSSQTFRKYFCLPLFSELESYALVPLALSLGLKNMKGRNYMIYLNDIIFKSVISFQMRIEILARLCRFFIFELKGKGPEPSRAENPSARAMARSNLAQTHH